MTTSYIDQIFIGLIVTNCQCVISAIAIYAWAIFKKNIIKNHPVTPKPDDAISQGERSKCRTPVTDSQLNSRKGISSSDIEKIYLPPPTGFEVEPIDMGPPVEF